MDKGQLRRAEELASRPYQIKLRAYEGPDGSSYFFGRVSELPGCVSDGDTEQEAKANVKLAMIDYIYFLLEDGLSVPEPRLFDKHIAIDMGDNKGSSADKSVREYANSLPLSRSYAFSGATLK